ncbi:MAG: TlpA family protein disulfide reductase [Candidatus Eremiobacteraeota bacterium]|nr:TlpA family protein disulfide reductase [Candidatus Eremiobacteraeota bacterium]
MVTWPAIVLAAVAVTSASTGLNGIKYAAPTPDFWLPASNGEARDLYSLRGRVVIIDFWATWCRVCVEEMPDFVQAKQQYGKRIAVITVSEEPPDVAARYFRQNAIPLTVVEDSAWIIGRGYSIDKWPVTLVLDPAGDVSYVSVGGLSWPELQGAIEDALRPGPSSPGSASTPAPRVLP